jgi:hypothetical protein
MTLVMTRFFLFRNTMDNQPLVERCRATMPLATGSPTVAKTIGIVRVSRWTATVGGVPPVRMICRVAGRPTPARALETD